MSARGLSVRVLVADDDGLLRDIATATLEAAGFVVEAVASGDAAVAACARHVPDIVLLDVEMPEGDGYQACTNIRTLPGGFDVPIVMVTGLDDPMSINLAYDAGATDFVVKPINWALLVHRIRYVLRGARTIEALRLSEQKNSALLKAIPDGIFLVNAAGAISHCFSPIAGLPAMQAQVAGALHLNELLPRGVLARAMQCLDATLHGTPAAFEFSLQGEQAAVSRHFECRYLPNASGQVIVWRTSMRSPGCRTANGSENTCRIPSPRPPSATAARRCCSWTSISSSVSTTRSVTRPGMRCSRRLRSD